MAELTKLARVVKLAKLAKLVKMAKLAKMAKMSIFTTKAGMSKLAKDQNGQFRHIGQNDQNRKYGYNG